MEPIILTAPPNEEKRLDAFLAEAVPDVSRSAAARLIESGRVLVDGAIAVKSRRLAGGETVALTLP